MATSWREPTSANWHLPRTHPNGRHSAILLPSYEPSCRSPGQRSHLPTRTERIPPIDGERSPFRLGEDMDDSLLDLVLERLNEIPLADEAAGLLLAACEGETSLPAPLCRGALHS